ncbi:AGE family epimerase/isomerase [Pseudomonas peli]|uniref:AGE family epimerase/isomerase n=1 Tax=Pseudomonas peli TaxID=592361 RepID=UPI003D15636C
MASRRWLPPLRPRRPWLEWARLVLHLEAARRKGRPAWPKWLVHAPGPCLSCQQWPRAGRWMVPRASSTPSTGNRPVVRQRLHWTHAEASAAARPCSAHRRSALRTWYRGFWDFCQAHLSTA